MKRIGGSFRDPSGFVFSDGERIVRTISESFRPHWEQGLHSGFLAGAVASGKLVGFSEAVGESIPELSEGTVPGGMPPVWSRLNVQRLPFISYPYEWCFSQLRDAALLTLDLHEEALDHGLMLKDASAYNVQFSGRAPVFMDLLSFALRPEDAPWIAYRQFCMHFLAPLAVQAKVGLWCGALSRLWIDGLPLAHAAALLPWRAKMSPGLALHLFAHARLDARHADARQTSQTARKATKVRQSLKAAHNLAQSLRATVEGLRPVHRHTEWGDYYADTNYSDEAAARKAELVERIVSGLPGNLALDLGANTGRYSRLLAPHFDLVLAADMDELAVERHYQGLRHDKEAPANILPLVLDLANPSPALGWNCEERESFAKRCQADCLLALALIHHLVISAGIPLPLVARQLAELVRPGGRLVLEEVPREDSQVQSLLAVREDIFTDYTPQGLRAAFAPYFVPEASQPVSGSVRTLHVWRRLA